MYPSVFRVQLRGQRLEKKTRDVFRRRVIAGKKRQLIEVLVIDLLKSVPGFPLHIGKIYQHAGIFKPDTTQDNLDPPIVPVKIFTLPSKVLQIVGGRKAANYFYFKNLLAQNEISLPPPGPS